MPKYKLVYFDARGRAEPARMLFHLHGQEFVDERFKGVDWPKLKTDKKKFPIGQVPVLCVDDYVMPHSKAIWRYLAREFDRFGENSLEGAQIDVVLETVSDVEQKITPIYGEKDEAKRAELVKNLIEKDSKPFFSFLVELIKAGDGKYFVGNKLSVADLVVFNILDVLTESKYKIDGLIDDYPELVEFSRSIREESELKSYLESRPVTSS